MSEATFSTRPLCMEDAHEYTKTATAIAACAGTHEQFQVANTLMMWQEPDFELANSSQGIFTDQGTLAAYVLLWATADKPVHPWLNWGVHPDFHGHGLDAALFEWAEQRSLDELKRCPREARFSLHSGTPVGFGFAESSLERAGYKAVRPSYEMRISMSQRPTVPQLPAGIAIKQYRHEKDLPLLVEIVRDSFSDHYGYVEEPIKKDLDSIRHWFNTDKNFDPELVVLAVHEPSETAAGCLIGLTEAHRYPGIGFIDAVGVGRAFRRRGLAQAMLYHSFAQFWDRGTPTVCLEVDGESLTNAVELYEKVGMYIHRNYMLYEKVLRDGVELAKVSME